MIGLSGTEVFAMRPNMSETCASFGQPGAARARGIVRQKSDNDVARSGAYGHLRRARAVARGDARRKEERGLAPRERSVETSHCVHRKVPPRARPEPCLPARHTQR